MMSQHDIAAIAARLQRISGKAWEFARSPDGLAVVRVVYEDGASKVLRVKRDFADASEADVRFVANAPRTVERLLKILSGRDTPQELELAAIASEVEASSPAPWMLSLEADGGMGGSNVITVSYDDDQPDLYLWLGSEFAPDADWKFVANARQDLPRMLADARTRLG